MKIQSVTKESVKTDAPKRRATQSQHSELWIGGGPESDCRGLGMPRLEYSQLMRKASDRYRRVRQARENALHETCNALLTNLTNNQIDQVGIE